MSQKNKVLHHLHTEYTNPIRDPLWKNIHVSDAMISLIRHEEFQKLGRIKQLGPAFLVYPGATHTRLNHSIGVFHIAKRILLKLLDEKNCPRLGIEGVKAFLVACLLHDLGHHPYAHSLKELPLVDHETLTARIIEQTSLSSIIKEKVGTDPGMVIAIIDTEKSTDNDELMFFRNILSGVLDPDKLDYLNRDAFFCGVPYGLQDTDYVINRIIPHRKHGLCMDQKDLMSIENILFSKYMMYKSVYWHKTIRIATAMIKKPILMGLLDEVITPDDLYGLDDYQLAAQLSKKDYIPFRQIGEVESRQLCKTVFETPYNEQNKTHQQLSNLSYRRMVEKDIALSIGQTAGITIPDEKVIIDIPEPISFEVNIPIRKGKKYKAFPKAGSVFEGRVVNAFKKTLRNIRIFMPEKTAESRHLLSALKEILPDV